MASFSYRTPKFATSLPAIRIQHFFYKRLKPLELAKDTDSIAEEKNFKLKQEGYTFVSLCGSERNYIRSQDTPIVFRELIQQDSDWYLKYGGTLTTLFQPESLKVDDRGYLYHPSPVKQRAARRRGTSKGTSPAENPSASPYGQYSLLRSELVVSTFTRSLEISEEGSGSYEWLGSRQAIRHLQGGEAILGKGWIG